MIATAPPSGAMPGRLAKSNVRVLLFTDGQVDAREATTWLERFAPAEPSSALRIVAVAQTPPVPTTFSAAMRALRTLALDQSRDFCESARSSLEPRWPDLGVEVLEGDPRERLLRAAETWKPELVVLGRRARGEVSPALSSVARVAAYHLDCSILLVDHAPESIREIVLGIDGSPSARAAIRLLSRCTFSPPPRIRALTIVNTTWRRTFELETLRPAVRRALEEKETQDASDARERLARTTVPLLERATVENEVATGNPVEVILHVARQGPADLLAVGHQGLEPVRRLPVGSVTAELLEAAPCSLLIGRA